MRRFKIGGKFKGPDPGMMIAIAEDDIEGRQIHDYRMTADNEPRSPRANQGGNADGRPRRLQILVAFGCRKQLAALA